MIEKKTKKSFYDLNWNKLNYTSNYPFNKEIIHKPKNLDLLIELAEKLAVGFPHVRVDLYVLKDYSIKFQMACFKYDNLLIEYMQKIILFGYINLFLIAVPLCPLFIFCILILEYVLDSYKLVHFINFN